MDESHVFAFVIGFVFMTILMSLFDISGFIFSYLENEDRRRFFRSFLSSFYHVRNLFVRQQESAHAPSVPVASLIGDDVKDDRVKVVESGQR
ncbi:hypothetical protein P4C99_21735 [Pontiellaceae bacterium B1224]|nr:hypothetical protein [Pontiellaceae bacterium B1224]